MKNFAFSLERMRGYKEQVLDREKNELLRLRKEKDKIEEKIEQITLYRRLKSAELQKNMIEAANLASYGFYMENTRLQLEGLAEELKKAEMEVEKQLHVVITASREVAGLDKLEEKQLEEYKVLEARDFNIQVEEHIVSGMLRRQEQD